MKIEDIKSRCEIYICNHKRDNQEDCFHKGGKEITDDLKAWAKNIYGKDVRIFRSGCLGKCEQGIVAVSYPSKEIIHDITKDDLNVLKEFIQEKSNLS